jgi:hypothetical protein
MYALNFSITGLMARLASCAAAHTIRGNTAALEIHAAFCNQLRRVNPGAQLASRMGKYLSSLSTHYPFGAD